VGVQTVEPLSGWLLPSCELLSNEYTIFERLRRSLNHSQGKTTTLCWRTAHTLSLALSFASWAGTSTKQHRTLEQDKQAERQVPMSNHLSGIVFVTSAI